MVQEFLHKLRLDYGHLDELQNRRFRDDIGNHSRHFGILLFCSKKFSGKRIAFWIYVVPNGYAGHHIGHSHLFFLCPIETNRLCIRNDFGTYHIGGALCDCYRNGDTPGV